ncbi:BTAD domain-containing putative transcriptional regulator [Dactylosporangium sp. NPDC005555]|uniref:BTAD domain-containing putative transcriptional regulator n=1 Tax=Dactylosporangium sp. NPDC005555 TaxID=3154889 RepID=UPI0033BBF7A9
MVRIGLLGGVRVTTGDGAPVDVGSAKTQTLLAALALSPGTPLPEARLIDLVWGDEPPRTAHKTLQWHIAQLRKGLGADAIARVGDAYRLDVAPDAVDVARFQRHARDGDPGTALTHWGGAPLAGLDAPGLAAAVAGLTEQWLATVETDLERRAGADPRGTAGALAEFAEQHPLRESAWGLLMTTLYRLGRQADALAAYRRARHHLVDQAGVEPGPALRDLEARILGHDATLLDTAVHSPEARGSTLPLAVGRLIGRDADLRAVAEAGAPVVTLVGPGGIGKTQLALAAARGQEREAWFVELAGIAAPADVPLAVADTIGAANRPGQSVTQSIVTALRARRALLVLDNCEHVLDGAATLAQAVVDGCPQVRVLATSRERLAVAGEQVLVVGPLDAAAGAELFHARAVAADRTYDALAHRAAVDELCRRLDGIPLAIELAAARTVSHRPEDLVARLDDHLLGVGGRRVGAARHRTLRAAIQWSYDLITQDEQTLLRELSVFAAPFDLRAAEAVTEVPDADGVLGDLVGRSMVTVAFGPAGRRFRLLETVRQFAAGHLRERGAADVVAGRHARWCAGEVAGIHGMLAGPGEASGVERLAELWPNLRAAVTWARTTGDAGLADALVRPLVTELPLRGRQELGDWAELILAMTTAGDPDLRAFWLLWVAERHTQNANPDGYREAADRYGASEGPLRRWADAYTSGDGETLRRCLPDAVADLHRQGEPDLAAFLELASAGTLLGIGGFAHVDAAVGALADRHRAGGPPTLLHWALQTLAYSAAFQGRSTDAERYFDEAAGVDVPPGTLSANTTAEARSAFRRGERPRALRLLRAYVGELLDTGNVVAASVVCIEFVNMTAALDRPAEASHMFGYLSAANDFGAMAARTLIPQAARLTVHDGPRIDDRAALRYMRDVLDELIAALP